MILNGKSRFAMVLGQPRENKFNPKNKVWSIGVVLDKEGIAQVKKAGIGAKIKLDEDTKEQFITFKRNEFDAKGNPNKPIEIITAQGKPWDHKVLIGNGSEVNVRVRTYPGANKQTNVAIDGVQVVKHVPYENTEKFPVYPDVTVYVEDNSHNDEEDIVDEDEDVA